MKTRAILQRLTMGLFVMTGLFCPLQIQAKETPASWNPSVTERLVKLPHSHLKKSIDRDFARSALAQAITDNEEDINLKVETMGDLIKAMEQAEGELRIELRHQMLAQKHAYLNLVKQRQDLRRQHLEKRKRLYGRILKKVIRETGVNNVETLELVRQQEEAQARFQKSSEAVDMKLFATFDAPGSKYAREYAHNLSAANALLKAINAHPMHKRHQPGLPKDKATYLRHLVSETESHLALVTQEDEILGYMAKLVSLDSSALAQQLESGVEIENADPDFNPQSPLTGGALNYFIQ